jgi:CheY-like chemotaxis protein
MEKTLVVDDAAMGRELAGGLLEERPDWTVPYAQDGKEALAQLERSTCPSQ